MGRRLRIALLVPLLGLVAGCGSAPLDGKVSVVGSTTLLPMLSAISGSFAADHPLVVVDERMKGTGDGLGLFCDGIEPLAGASRPMSERELRACRTAGVRFVRLHVADDAVVLFTARSGQVACLTGEQIYALMGPQSTGVDTWPGASGIVPGAGDGLPDAPLNVIGPNAQSGTRNVLVDLVIKPIAEDRDVRPGLRSDYQSQQSDQLIVDAVAGNPGALGFAGLATTAQGQQRLRFLQVDLGQGCVEPDLASIRAGRYPLGRPLYLYVDLTAARDDATLRAFVDAVLSADGLSAATEAGSVALDDNEADAVRAHWRAAIDTGKGDRA